MVDDAKNLEADVKANTGVSAPPAETETTEPTPTTPAPDASAQEKSRYQARIDQLTAARRAAEERARVAEERLVRVEQERRATVVPGQRPGQEVQMVGNMTKEDWLAWHEEDPLAATEFVSDLKANQKAQQIVSQMQSAGAYADTVSQVYAAHPELKEVMEGKKSPEEVPFWQVYDEVAREMPEAQQLAKGPILVMKEAERRIKERELAEKEKKIADNAATQESARQQRVGASYTLGSNPKPPSVGSVKLNAEEEKIARKMGMSPEEYAKNKKAVK